MVYCEDNISQPRRYIQFNDLVFYGQKSIEEQSESISLRESKTSRTFTNGSYVANIGRMSLVDSNSITLKIALLTSKWSEEHVQGHYDFIVEQLMTPGKLWAVQSGLQLVWCNAYVTSIQPQKNWVVTDDDYLVFSVEFDNPDGVWYKADEARTYLAPYDNCDFLDMKAACLGKSKYCCIEPLDCSRKCDCCDDKCDDMCDMINLCEAQTDIRIMNDFFDECNSKWRVVYNCEKAKKDGKTSNELYPHVICDGCITDTFSGSFLSRTVLDSHKWSFALMGNFVDPIIRVNYRQLKIKGNYNGVITIDYRGNLRFAKSWECIEYDYQELPLHLLEICAETPYIQKGLNQVSVHGVKDGSSACVYINYEAVTI